MSEQQNHSDRPATPNTKQQGPDDREPTPERQAELRAAYEANVAAGKAPYIDVPILTRGELRWVLQQRRWSGSDPMLEEDERADLSGAYLYQADLSGVDLNLANLSEADLTFANLSGAYMHYANLSRGNLRGANLRGAVLPGANLSGAHLDDADLHGTSLNIANLSGADLPAATLSEANLRGANLSGANLRGAQMDATTSLLEARLDSHTRLADVVWNGVPLTRLNWPEVARLGDEQVARHPKDVHGKRKNKATRLHDYADAVLAYRQVATVLRSQGLNEHADRFAYRAQLLQRRLLRLQRYYLRYLGSLFLGLIAGYGYRPLRSFATYLLVVTVFGLAFWALGVQTGQTLT
ncbi:MAG TPA: pentapeptide repeat-containing protein, partial [Ktedonobacterales bacterium]|nr:pentapeptide repeat-containing protein [Ktedonobacterales bacterium]